MQILCGIYGIKNTVNGKWYIGQSLNIVRKRYNHFSLLKCKKHANKHLQDSYNKYGIKFFEHHILELVTEEMLDARECAWIAYYKSADSYFGYNIQPGGNLRKHHTDVTREKISQALSGRNFSKEHCENLRQAFKNRPPVSIETRLKLSAIRKGRKLSLETKRKIGKGNKGKIRSTEFRKHLSNINKGHKHTAETRKKMSCSHIGKRLSALHIANSVAGHLKNKQAKLCLSRI